MSKLIFRRAGMYLLPTMVLMSALAMGGERSRGVFRVESVVHVRGREPFRVATEGPGGRKISLPFECFEVPSDSPLGNTIALPGTKQDESLGHDVQIVVSRNADRVLNCDIEWRFRAASRGATGGPRIMTTSVREIFISAEQKPQRLVFERDVDGDPRTWMDFIVKVAQIYIVTYNAADLVIPVDAGKHGAQPDFDPLMKAIRRDIQPDAWETEGGDCTITSFPRNLSLVICATQGMHAEVQLLLDKLRQERVPVEPK